MSSVPGGGLPPSTSSSIEASNAMAASLPAMHALFCSSEKMPPRKSKMAAAVVFCCGVVGPSPSSNGWPYKAMVASCAL
jgi:hypothetical protein